MAYPRHDSYSTIYYAHYVVPDGQHPRMPSEHGASLLAMLADVLAARVS